MQVSEVKEMLQEGKFLKLSYEDIRKIFSEEFKDELENYEGDIDCFWSEDLQYSNLETDNYKLESEIAAAYGGESQDHEYWKVSKLTDKRTGEYTFIKFEGWYSSYNGPEWQDWNIVEPCIKEVIDWN